MGKLRLKAITQWAMCKLAELCRSVDTLFSLTGKREFLLGGMVCPGPLVTLFVKSFPTLIIILNSLICSATVAVLFSYVFPQTGAVPGTEQAFRKNFLLSEWVTQDPRAPFPEKGLLNPESDVMKTQPRLSQTWALSLLHDFCQIISSWPELSFLCHMGHNSLSAILKWKNFFFSWSIVDLQCCVSFWCIAKWFSYIFFIFFSIMVYYSILNTVPCAIQ